MPSFRRHQVPNIANKHGPLLIVMTTFIESIDNAIDIPIFNFGCKFLEQIPKICKGRGKELGGVLYVCIR